MIKINPVNTPLIVGTIISGTANPGIVTLKIPGNSNKKVTVEPAGNWSYTITKSVFDAIPLGPLTIVATEQPTSESVATKKEVTTSPPTQPIPTPGPIPQTDWPNRTNTGVQPGITLTPSISLALNAPGAVISGFDIKGTVYINADNIKLVNCKVTDSSFYLVKIAGGVKGTVIQNCEINGIGIGNEGCSGIAGQGTFIANNIYNVENAITLQGNDSIIQDNYIHDLKASGSPHYDGIQIDGGISNVTITHNTVINQNSQTAAVMIDNYFGPISNIKVDNNILVGGGYTIYVDGQFSGGAITNVSVTNNHFGKGQWGEMNYNKTSPVSTGNMSDGKILADALPK